MKSNQQTELTRLLLEPNMKSGLVVAPTYTGRSYAACAKAIALALEGQDVLLVKESKHQHFTQGSTLDTLTKILEEHEDTPKWRVSKESGWVTINEKGKIKLAGLDFTPDKEFDTVIVDHSIKFGDTRRIKCGKNRIVFTTAWELVENYMYGNNYVMCRPPLKEKFNLRGEVSELQISPVPFTDLASNGDGWRKVCNSAGYFTLEITKRDKFLEELNPLFLTQLKGLPAKDCTRLTATDYMSCYHLMNYVGKSEEIKPVREYDIKLMGVEGNLVNIPVKEDYKVIGVSRDLGDKIPMLKVPEELVDKQKPAFFILPSDKDYDLHVKDEETLVLRIPKKSLDDQSILTLIKDASKMGNKVIVELS